jgi:hypothetical protein
MDTIDRSRGMMVHAQLFIDHPADNRDRWRLMCLRQKVGEWRSEGRRKREAGGVRSDMPSVRSMSAGSGKLGVTCRRFGQCQREAVSGSVGTTLLSVRVGSIGISGGRGSLGGSHEASDQARPRLHEASDQARPSLRGSFRPSRSVSVKVEQ